MSPVLEILSNPAKLLHPATASDRVLPALMVTIAFGVAAYLLRGVTRTGALAGTFVAFVIYLGLGWGGFVTLVAVFVVTWVCTRVGLVRKQQLGLAQDRRGRDAGQVLANVATAALFAALALRNQWFAVASVAAMAEAAADTAQSEIGEIASGRAWLITTFREVSAGTDGGVTFPGLLAGAVAAAMAAIVARLTGAIEPRFAGVAGVAGFLGSVADSLLGATLERRGWLNNNGVNFLSTLVSGAIAITLLYLLGP